MSLNQGQLVALRTLGQVTNNRFDVDRLMGPVNAPLRAQILSFLTLGTATGVPKSKAGVTALEAAFFGLVELPPTCRATQKDNFREWALQMLGSAK